MPKLTDTKDKQTMFEMLAGEYEATGKVTFNTAPEMAYYLGRGPKRIANLLDELVSEQKLAKEFRDGVALYCLSSSAIRGLLVEFDQERIFREFLDRQPKQL